MQDDIKNPKKRGFSLDSLRDQKNPIETPISEPSFKTPEEIIEEEENLAETLDTRSQPLKPTDSKPKKPNLGERIGLWWKSLSKKQKILFCVLLVLLLGGASAGAWSVLRSKPEPKPVAQVEEKIVEPPKPTTEASRLTGVQIAPEINKRHITGVMVENSPDARPQAGLKDAGVIYEAIAEGGITRFLLLYQETDSDYIGPVRSSRPYYLDFLMPYDASYGHVGGSGDALAQIKALGIKDMDQMGNSAPYQRVSNRIAPHNVYTSTAKLRELEAKKGWTTSSVKSLARKEKEAPSAQITARAIDFKISSTLYNVHYDYNPATNSYNRVMGGKPHTDERSGAQLSPKVVVALVMQKGANGKYTTYSTNSGGKVVIFQDGIATEGTWSKPDRRDQFAFRDAAGQPLALIPGQTWFTLVSAPTDVTFVP